MWKGFLGGLPRTTQVDLENCHLIITAIMWCTYVCLLLLGLRESDVAECVEWMRTFAHVLERQEPLELKKFSQIPADNAHNIQTHAVSLELLVCGVTSVTIALTVVVMISYRLCMLMFDLHDLRSTWPIWNSFLLNCAHSTSLDVF